MGKVEIQRIRLRLAQRLLQFFLRQILIQGHGDAEAAQVSPITQDPLVAVLADDGQALAGHAAAQPCGAQGVDVLLYFDKRAGAVFRRRRLRLFAGLDLKCDIVSEAVGAAVDQRPEIAI